MPNLAYKNPKHVTVILTSLFTPIQNLKKLQSLAERETHHQFCIPPVFPMARVFNVLAIFCVMLLVQKTSARQFTVGGSNGWTAADNSSGFSYNQWAEHNRFQIGDSLLFVYNANQDSVLQVTKEDYNNCSSSSPIDKHADGHTVFTFNQSGPIYFISGNKDNCLKNEKLVVVVLADRTKREASPPSPTSVETSPAPSPAGEGTPPSPTSVETSPAPATNKTNAAAATYVSFIGSIGALFASSLVLVV